MSRTYRFEPQPSTGGCDQCAAVMINGVFCHEQGCPNSWKDANGKGRQRECRWCGQKFVPKDKGQRFCDDECQAAFCDVPYVLT
jgi:hypothetical protein